MYFKFASSLVLFSATIICFNFECMPSKMRHRLPGGTTMTNSHEPHPVGCETLFEGTAPITADIVFVHGLRGHRRNTWTKDNVCWPRDLLSKEEGLSRTRILAFGYDANIINPIGPASLNSLFEHSINLLNELAGERKQDARDRPIIFVAHSLGGLIVKDALDFSDRVSETKPHLAQIFSATRGIIFLGTPHRGSGMASLANVVASVAQVSLQYPNVDLVRDLERDSQTLDRIGDSFSRILDRRRLTVWSFVEELPIPGIGKVVHGDSAIIHDAREYRGTIRADHMGMAKFSSRNDFQYRKVLNAIEVLLEALTEDKGASGEHKVTFYDIPSFRVPHFVVRKTLVTRLRESFEHSNTTSIVALVGMGGAGKTQLALEYCRDVRDSGTHRAIFWLDASSRNATYRGMEAIANHLLPERVIDHPHAALTLVKTILSGWSEQWLMVFDGLDNPSDLSDILSFFPDSRSGSILLTSRHAGSRMLGRSIELDRMEHEEGLQLLCPQGISSEDLPAAEQILTRLEYHPLAIDQARAYISRRQLPLRDLVDEYERQKRVMQETPPFWNYRGKLPNTETEISLSLSTTWEMSLSLLGAQTGQVAELGELLALFAFFNPVTISEIIFISDSGDATDITTSPVSVLSDNFQWNHGRFEDAVVQMQELSLLQFSRRRNGNEIVVSLHSLVSEWLYIRLRKDRRSALLATAIWHLQNCLDSTRPHDFRSRQDALSHIDYIWRIVENLNETNRFFGAYVSFGTFYADHGRFEDAERMYNRALAGFEQAWGPEHTKTLSTVNKLGILYLNQGRLEDADRMLNHALVGFEKACGPEHTNTLDTVHNLGSLYVDQGRFNNAERMYNRALAGREKVLGHDHTSTLDTVHYFGNLHIHQHRLADAERMFNRALAGREKAWGPEHMKTLDTVNNLGSLYRNQGRLEDAEMMFNRALAGKEKAWGPEHTRSLSTVHNLGALYNDQGRLGDAERMYNRALAGREKAWGPEHTITLHTVHNLGGLHLNQGRLEDAERMYSRALAGFEEARGPDHTTTLIAVNNLGILYVTQGRLEDAERMYNRALAGFEQVWGPEHTRTLGTADNLRTLYGTHARIDHREGLSNRALAGFEQGRALSVIWLLCVYILW